MLVVGVQCEPVASIRASSGALGRGAGGGARGALPVRARQRAGGRPPCAPDAGSRHPHRAGRSGAGARPARRRRSCPGAARRPRWCRRRRSRSRRGPRRGRAPPRAPGARRAATRGARGGGRRAGARSPGPRPARPPSAGTGSRGARRTPSPPGSTRCSAHSVSTVRSSIASVSRLAVSPMCWLSHAVPPRGHAHRRLQLAPDGHHRRAGHGQGQGHRRVPPAAAHRLRRTGHHPGDGVVAGDVDGAVVVARTRRPGRPGAPRPRPGRCRSARRRGCRWSSPAAPGAPASNSRWCRGA